jgi:D-alanine--D-alanine ligase
MKVVVLGGGDSPEREVSLRSAAAVVEAAKVDGYEVNYYDPRRGLDFLKNYSSAETAVLPILHGSGGEDGRIQQELEKHGFPYLGSDSKSSAECFDKWKTREILTKENINIPAGILVNKLSYIKQNLTKRPHVLKVRRGGSSIGTLICRDNKSLSGKELDMLFDLDEEALLEELIQGVEITVPILDQQALTPVEIIPPPDGEFDYENKYNGASRELSPPKNVGEQIQAAAKKIAEKVHKAMGCKHLSRIDMMIDNNDKIYVLEINTIPGLTPQSLYPKGALASGLHMTELVKKFVELIKRDYAL